MSRFGEIRFGFEAQTGEGGLALPETTYPALPHRDPVFQLEDDIGINKKIHPQIVKRTPVDRIVRQPMMLTPGLLAKLSTLLQQEYDPWYTLLVHCAGTSMIMNDCKLSECSIFHRAGDGVWAKVQWIMKEFADTRRHLEPLDTQLLDEPAPVLTVGGDSSLLFEELMISRVWPRHPFGCKNEMEMGADPFHTVTVKHRGVSEAFCAFRDNRDIDLLYSIAQMSVQMPHVSIIQYNGYHYEESGYMTTWGGQAVSYGASPALTIQEEQ